MPKVRVTQQAAKLPAPPIVNLESNLESLVQLEDIPAVDFTYVLTTNVGKLRLEIGDETYGSGVKPNGDNFTDDELEYFLTQEGDSVGRAAARACEVLARAFAGLVDLSVGPRRESLSQAAKAYAERAKELRRQYGGATSGVYSAGWMRSEDGNPTDEYPTSGNEYASGSTDDWWRS